MAETSDQTKQAPPQRLRPYPSYKDSDVEWLGEIPAHWDIKKWRYCCRIAEGQVPPDDERFRARVLIAPNHIESDTGRILYLESAEEQGAVSGKYLVQPGQIVYSKIRPALNKVCMAAGNWLCSADMYPVSAIDRRLATRFLLYFMLSDPFVRLMVDESMRVAMPKVNRDRLAACPIIIPHPAEQLAIVRFLDRETARIDALVDRKERLIELLQEKRAALITRAVTIGRDPNVPMKDSGVEWLGEIPAHWEPARLWRLCTAMSGATPTKENSSYWNGEIPWVSPKDMKRRVISTSADRITQQALRETGIHLIEPRVVLVVVRGMILAHSFPVALTTVPVTINQDMKALRLYGEVDPFYFAWALDGLARGIIATVVEEAAHGTRAIRMDQWQNLVCPLPPLPDQLAIVEYLDFETAKIDGLIEKIGLAIERLGEHRTALISAAVTGKIDVRNESS